MSTVDGVTEPEQPRLLPLLLLVPDELEAGIYASGVNIWWTPTDMVFDFGVVLPTVQVDTDEGPGLQTRARVVARVRIPPGQVFEVVKGLNDALTGYEAQYGNVSGSSSDDPLYPPQE